MLACRAGPCRGRLLRRRGRRLGGRGLGRRGDQIPWRACHRDAQDLAQQPPGGRAVPRVRGAGSRSCRATGAVAFGAALAYGSKTGAIVEGSAVDTRDLPVSLACTGALAAFRRGRLAGDARRRLRRYRGRHRALSSTRPRLRVSATLSLALQGPVIAFGVIVIIVVGCAGGRLASSGAGAGR